MYKRQVLGVFGFGGAMLVGTMVVWRKLKQRAAERDLRELEEDVRTSNGCQLEHVHVLALLLLQA